MVKATDMKLPNVKDIFGEPQVVDIEGRGSGKSKSNSPSKKRRPQPRSKKESQQYVIPDADALIGIAFECLLRTKSDKFKAY